MSVRPVDFNGMMQNSQEVSVSRTHEEQRPVVQQEIGSISLDAEIEESTHQVHEQDDTGAESALNPDDGGGNQTNGRGRRGTQKKKKNKSKVSDGKVSIKGAHKSFEVTI